ncbi:MAG: TetR/AcrR family transcriptional regulator [Minwuiales bacterium]|nr:TetR/AcrR family transcriptional regulator [Minwuiales bacterium]
MAAKAPRKAAIPDAIIDAALDLAAVQGWHQTTLTDIAEHAKVSLADLYSHYPSKTAILAGFSRRVDMQTLSGMDPEDREQPARERLFDLIMRRFDALGPHREAVRSILRDAGREPVSMLCMATGPFARSLKWMLEAAEIRTGGLLGPLRIKGLGFIYLSVMRVWLDDDSEDMAKTMADLDKRLKRAESMMSMAPGRRRRGDVGGDAAEAAI